MDSERLTRLEPGDGLVDLVLVRGRGNAFTGAGLVELAQVLAQLVEDGSPPLVLRSAGRSFCTGLDLEHCLDLDRDGMRALMEAFHRALTACVLYPGPVVAAVGGPALAGGALLALACDRRLGAEGHARFGVHGVQLGVSYPQVAIEIARERLGERGAARLLFAGRLLDAHEAWREGWIDDLVASADLVARAREQGRMLAVSGVFARVKARVRAPLAARLRDLDRAGMDAWLDQWFSADTRARVEHSRRHRGTPSSEAPTSSTTSDRGRTP